MEARDFDLIVIGSGPAGEKGAAQAAYFGKSVALIEKEPVLGGASANTGTLPSKTLRETALFLSGFRNRDLGGIKLQLDHQVTISDFMVHEQAVNERERARIIANLDRHRVEVFRGTASLVDPHTVAVQPASGPAVQLRGDVILIAVGSRPYHPPVFPFEDPRIDDSDTILQLPSIPPSMLVVGGGVIGCEYACMFAILGVEVTVVEQRDRLLGSLDAEVAEAVRRRMESIGIRLFLSDSVEAFHAGETVEARLKSGAVLKPHTTLISSGRNGNTVGLGLENVGVAGRFEGAHRGRRALPDGGPAHLRRRRRHRLARPGVDRDGAGARRHGQRLRPQVQGQGGPHPPLRHLHHPRVLDGGRDRGGPEGEGHPLRGRQGHL